MPPASFSTAFYGDRPLRERAAGAGVALGITIALIWALLGLAPPFERRAPQGALMVSFGLLPEARRTPTRTRTTARAQHVASRTSHATKASAPQHSTVAWPSEFVLMNSSDFAASDIAKLPSHPRETAEASSAPSTAQNGRGDASGEVGAGPGGATLYDADWYRKPSNAELGFYLRPTAPPSGWGMIACRTVEDYRVEDCRALAESPAGSGFAYAVLKAAWQFRVLPPRINGRPLIGAWVRIRIDYIEGQAK